MTKAILPRGKKILVYVPRDVLDQLDEAARFLGYARSKLIRDALEVAIATRIQDQIEGRKKLLKQMHQSDHRC